MIIYFLGGAHSFLEKCSLPQSPFQLVRHPSNFFWCSQLPLLFQQKNKVHMAYSVLASLPPPLLVHRREALVRALNGFPVSINRGRQSSLSVVAKATGESSESSTTLSIVKSVQNVWGDPEDRFALFGLGFAAIVAVWASANLITAIDNLPLIPGVFEFIGILYSWWFIYRYLLFKPNREELFEIINKSVSEVLGQ
ncbi:protein CURVATURE THYLAKOID 1C, chloroplastic [Vitis vinifera]|uniref:protein CURVATURE THYLAKOID 1C, chloroplastic n=1 Tax=Vitis vinifera TaxID=29760 RepID=UPI0028831E28|nr:protein CURVATURE THYLAKOID 1C, chloroplastic [Vitis vinifera]